MQTYRIKQVSMIKIQIAGKLLYQNFFFMKSTLEISLVSQMYITPSPLDQSEFQEFMNRLRENAKE